MELNWESARTAEVAQTELCFMGQAGAGSVSWVAGDVIEAMLVARPVCVVPRLRKPGSSRASP